MNYIFSKFSMATAALLLACAGQTSATTLTFDDITQTNGVVALSQNYGGLNWDAGPSWALGWQVWYTSQGSYPAASGAYVAFAHANSIGVSFNTDAVFDGAAFGGNTQVQYNLYLDNQLVHTSAFASMGTGGNPAAWVASGYAGLVDRVQVITNGAGSDWVMDNFTYNSVSAVPEPESYALMLAGLGLVGHMVRRRKQKATAA